MIAAIHGTRRLILFWQGWQHEELHDIVNGDTNGIVGAGLAPALRLTLPPSSIPHPALPPILRPTLHFLARYKTLVLVQAGHLIARVQPRILPLTLPAWRNVQWRLFSAPIAPLTTNVSRFPLQL